MIYVVGFLGLAVPVLKQEAHKQDLLRAICLYDYGPHEP